MSKAPVFPTMAVPTVEVKVKGTNQKVLINHKDFDASRFEYIKEEVPAAAAEPTPVADQPAPAESKPKKAPKREKVEQ